VVTDWTVLALYGRLKTHRFDTPENLLRGNKRIGKKKKKKKKTKKKKEKKKKK
jgi:hypothetical protein